MTDFCEITGLSSENSEKFNYLHHYITNSKEIATPDNDVLKGFIKPLENTVSANKIHNSDTKRRESLFKHLEKSIASKFDDSKLTVFGSVESGLSLKGGDFDLCLQIPNANQKKVLKRIGGMLRGQGMENVQKM